MRPEMPYLAAGAVALAGGTARQHRFPSRGGEAMIATIVIVVLASATAGAKGAPVVRAIGMLLLLTVIMAAVPALTDRKRK